jgi:hypothetical protein
MLQNQGSTESPVDAKTAEKALALAIRIQQKRGEQISMEELQRTADEAGIDRESLQLALEHLKTTEVAPTKRPPLGVAPFWSCVRSCWSWRPISFR